MDTSKKSDSPPAGQDRRRYHVLDWFFVACGVVMLAFYLPDYYTSSNPSAAYGFSIALGMLLIWMGAIGIGLRGAGSAVQIWLGWTLVALFWIPMFHPSSGNSAAGTYRALLDALTFAEPIASAFLYPALLAIVIAFALMVRRARAEEREAGRMKLEAAGVDVDGD